MLARFVPPSLKPRQLNCKQVEEILLAFKRDDLPEAQARLVQNHLERCGECREQLAGLQAFEADLYSQAARNYPAIDPVVEQRIHLRLQHTLNKGVLMARFNQGIKNSLRLVGIAAGLLLVLAAIFFLGQPQATSPAESTPAAPSGAGGVEVEASVITFAAYEVSQPYYERLIEQFNLLDPEIQVQFVPLSDGSFNDSLALASTADVVLFPFSMPPDSGGYYRDLKPLLDSDANFDPTDFWPSLFNACQDGEGRQTGIPLYASLWGVFYDPISFENHGVAYPSPDWTLDDLRSAVEILSNREEHTRRFGLADNPHLVTSILRPYVEAILVQSSLENPLELAENMERELGWYVDLARSGDILPIGSQQGDWEAQFTEGRPPAIWVGQLSQPMPGTSSGYTPEQPLTGMAISEQGYAPFPRGSAAAASMTPFSPACAAISAGSTDARRSWSWLAYLSRQEHIENVGFGSQLLRVPARRSVVEANAFFDRIPSSQQASVGYALEHLWPDTHSNDVLNAVHEALLAAISGPQGLAEALANRLAGLAAAPAVPLETQEFVVATPQPTPLPGQPSARFYFLGLSEGEKMALTELEKAYNQAHPETSIRVLFNYDLPEDLNFTRGFAEQFDCYTWYSPAFFDPSQMDNMLILDAFFEAEPVSFSQDFYAEQVELYRHEGHLYGLPATGQPKVMFYNADLLRKRGLEIPDIDWTYEEFLDLAQAAASTDENDLSYGFLFDEWEDLFEYYYPMDWMDGNSDQPKALFDSPQTLNFLNWLYDLRKANVLFVKYDTQYFPAWEAFQEGKIAFWAALAGDPFVYYFADSMDASYNIGVLPLPLLPEGKKYHGIPISRGYFISPKSDSPQLCWDWIKFLSEQPNALEGVPARASVATSSSWIALVGEEKAAVFRRALGQYEPVPVNHVGGAYYTWRHEVMQAALSGSSLERLLIRMQDKADRYITCMVEADASRLGYQEMVEVRERCTAEAES